MVPQPAPTPYPTSSPSSAAPTSWPTSSPTTDDTVSVAVEVSCTADAIPDSTDYTNLESSIDTTLGVANAEVKNLAIAYATARRLSEQNDNQRRLTTYTWTITCDIVASLSAVGETSGTAFQSTVETNLNSGTTLSDNILAAVSSVTSVDSVSAGLVTNSPTMVPSQPSPLPTKQPIPSPSTMPTVPAGGNGSSQASLNIVVIGIACVGVVLLGVMVYVCKKYSEKVDENEYDKTVEEGNGVNDVEESRDRKNKLKNESLDRSSIDSANFFITPVAAATAPTVNVDDSIDSKTPSPKSNKMVTPLINENIPTTTPSVTVVVDDPSPHGTRMVSL
eukprot:CAMPEP_0114337730 /NCGR_PEP_ID=MMETSP0101-20121206/6561_1 /TAXON_ID=38822 ORGANISM="Pteridomonas danica, Strain PT" /NCGR_SAMPLE_ID=MMETSP0101 /ASSEMBLY_ACC=CAM_ASM_000211 /LENGTH=333 /DNA_ID=CAMNT_0001470069 /DNA_START=556 /DNA_END=1557 /DNA_ORIENTATION=+